MRTYRCVAVACLITVALLGGAGSSAHGSSVIERTTTTLDGCEHDVYVNKTLEAVTVIATRSDGCLAVWLSTNLGVRHDSRGEFLKVHLETGGKGPANDFDYCVRPERTGQWSCLNGFIS